MAVTKAEEIAIRIFAQVKGQEKLTALGKSISEINRQLKDSERFKIIATRQIKDETAALKESNGIMKARVQMNKTDFRRLAVQKNIQEDNTHLFKNRMVIEQDALRFQTLAKNTGMKLSITEARVVAEQNMKIVAAEEAATIATRNKARALMQVSISLFVMNISANQLVSSLKPLVKNNEMATQALTDFQAILNLTLGPLQAYLALLQITNAMQMQMTQTVGMLALALGAMMIMFIAIRQESPAIRAALGAISGALIAVTVLAYQAALAKTMFAGAVQLAIASMGGPVGFAIGLAAAGAGLAVMIGFIAKAKSAQTRVGQMKLVSRSGLAEIHEGEEISRPRMGDRGVREGGGEITIFLPESFRGTMSQSRFFAEEVNRLVRSGRGTVKVKRVVVS